MTSERGESVGVAAIACARKSALAWLAELRGRRSARTPRP